MVNKTSGTDKIVLMMNRRIISFNSGLDSVSSDTVLGSKAIPQIGQSPGSSLTTSGCIGQTYSVFTFGMAGATGSRAIPQCGHDPGPSWRTSGCIGHV